MTKYELFEEWLKNYRRKMKVKKKIKISIEEYEKLTFFKDFVIKHFIFHHNPRDKMAGITVRYWDWNDTYEEYGECFKGLEVRESIKLGKDIDKLNKYMKDEKYGNS